MNDTLQLKQLKYYLDTECKFISEMDVPENDLFKNPIWTLDGVTRLFGGYCLNTRENSDAYTIESCKLLLHPLSRLTILGNDDIPVNEHTINLLLEKKHGVEYGFLNCYKGKLTIELEADTMIQYDQMKSFPFEVLQTLWEELFKSHYDVFGLIEKGLALEKPLQQN